MVFNQLLQAQQRFQNELLAKANVVGVAVGFRDFMGETTDELALVAMVEQKKPVEALQPGDLVPREMDGARTDVMEVGRLRAQQLTPRSRWRPNIPSGVSVAHPLVTAGTLGTIVRERGGTQLYMLSNNHVIANSNDALVGDPVLQPGPTDHGKNPEDIVARLERWIPLKYIGDPIGPPPSPPPPPPPGGGNPPPPTSGCDIADLVATLGNTLARLNGSDKRLAVESASASSEAVVATRDPITAQSTIPINSVDCAIATLLNPDMFTREILEIGQVIGKKPPVLGMRVRKMGRTTGYTEGMINLVNATVDVSYNTISGTKTARFAGQVMTTGMSQGGDSGSLIVEVGSQSAVGLLFAGSPITTIFSPIDLVLDALNIDLA